MNATPPITPAAEQATDQTLVEALNQHAGARHGLIYRAVVYGSRLSPQRRRRLYALVLFASLALVWGPISTVILLMPPRYTSEWTLIMPGAGSGHAVNLDSIGQATANVASPFTNSSIDPLVNYREIATSAPVLGEAAAALGLSRSDFAKPRIKLVDQTAMMHFQVRGPSAELAREKSVALYTALQRQLDKLRDDEVVRITAASLDTLEDFSAKLQRSQRERLNYQSQTHIVSVEQFEQLVTRMEQERATLSEQRARRAALQGEIDQLQEQLSLRPEQLRHALTLRNDTLFQAHLSRHAEIHAQEDTVDGTWGADNPRLAQLHAAHDSINDALVERGRRITGVRQFSAAELIDLGSNVVDASLLEQLAQRRAELSGLNGALNQQHQTFAELSERIDRSAADAVKLEELSRKQQVATAVFSTALAKQDIGKVDRFASYPLLQMLAEPTLPEGPDRMHLKLALLGGIAATLFILFGLVLLWIRKPLLQQMLKSGSSGSH